MADLKSLWVGDMVTIKSSGRTGKFEGVNQEGKARISVGGRIILTNVSNLEILPDEAATGFDIDRFLEEEKQAALNAPLKVKANEVLDLHIDRLAPDMVNDLPQRILEYQLAASEKFIREAIRLNAPQITIIHGKGAGVLRQAIEVQLKMFPQVRFTFSKNQGGAVEIWLL